MTRFSPALAVIAFAVVVGVTLLILLPGPSAEAYNTLNCPDGSP